jgi:dihydroorotate dehydrogenase
VIGLFRALARPLLGLLDAENAHTLAIKALKHAPIGRAAPDDASLAVRAFGLNFPNPVGMAAGFDKHGEVPDALLRLGFGFVEIGTVTPRPQPGNQRPRLFRLPRDEGVINRLGFNSEGADPVLRRLAARANHGGLVGVNVGANKDTIDRIADYVRLIEVFAPVASYFTVNISSPNTPGLRDLQGEARLQAILRAVRTAVPSHPPLLVKIAPDLASEALTAIVETCVAESVHGLIVSNTTITRPHGLHSPAIHEAGGLSGTPLLHLSTAVLARAYLLARGRLVLIGVGGVSTGEHVLMKIRAGASLVQLYTAFAYAGPALIPRLKRQLIASMRTLGFAHVRDAVGKDAERLAEYH